MTQALRASCPLLDIPNQGLMPVRIDTIDVDLCAFVRSRNICMHSQPHVACLSLSFYASSPMFSYLHDEGICETSSTGGCSLSKSESLSLDSLSCNLSFAHPHNCSQSHGTFLDIGLIADTV